MGMPLCLRPSSALAMRDSGGQSEVSGSLSGSQPSLAFGFLGFGGGFDLTTSQSFSRALSGDPSPVHPSFFSSKEERPVFLGVCVLERLGKLYRYVVGSLDFNFLDSLHISF